MRMRKQLELKGRLAVINTTVVILVSDIVTLCDIQQRLLTYRAIGLTLDIDPLVLLAVHCWRFDYSF